MQYKPFESAVKYFIGVYESAKNIVQKLENSLIPNSGLELAVAGMPNLVLNRQPETPYKTEGYLFAEYSVRDYRRKGKAVVITRSDGKQIPLEPLRNGNFTEAAVRQALTNNSISANNKLVGRIAKLLRERH